MQGLSINFELNNKPAIKADITHLSSYKMSD